MGKKLRKALLTLGVLLLFGVIVLSSYHHRMLLSEQGKLTPPGRLYTINGHQMHLYTEGPKNGSATLVFLSGSGTAAPVYDFKILYSKLSSHYPIAVVERSGYGYSEVSGAPRDIATVVEENRSLLAAAGEHGPYLLVAHSLSGLEALYWAQEYPDEIGAIIGLDLSVPQADIPYSPMVPPLLKAASFLGLQRLPFLYPIDYVGLTESERRQAEYLTYRNAFNGDIASELSQTEENKEKIDLSTLPPLPILDFISNDAQSQQEHAAFAQLVPVKSIQLDAGHYVHQFASEEIAAEIFTFLQQIGYGAFHALDHIQPS